MNNVKLTGRQRVIVDYMLRHLVEYQRLPTLREIALEFGMSSPTGAVSHIQALIGLGILSKCEKSRTRNYRLNGIQICISGLSYVAPVAGATTPVASAVAPVAGATTPVASAVAPVASAVAPVASAVAPVASAVASAVATRPETLSRRSAATTCDSESKILSNLLTMSYDKS